MPSFTTIFRAIVMLVTAVLLVKGWQSYGPSTEQLKSIASRAIEVASAGSKQSDEAAGPNTGLVAERQGAAPLAPRLADGDAMAPQAAEHMPNVGSTGEKSAMPDAWGSAPVSEAGSDRTDEDNITSGQASAHLSALLERLATLGGKEPKLTAWGTAGDLYRFSCRAAIADAPSFGRHFEAVSSEPQKAVEDVVAKVAAWRTAQMEQHRVQ